MSYKRADEYDGTSGPGDKVAAPHAAALIVLGALIFLMVVRKGFRGFSAPGVGAVKLG